MHIVRQHDLTHLCRCRSYEVQDGDDCHGQPLSRQEFGPDDAVSQRHDQQERARECLAEDL